MCGINGIIKKNNAIDKEQLIKMNNAIKHRGPDEEGYFIQDNIGLCHRRLSIIDLKSGQQPMHSKDNRITVVFNGEIYNYNKIKNNLKTKGYNFSTTSDTEVIIYGYIEFGTKIFEKLDGMFALAIYDRKTDEIIIARDKFGEKPLYYYHNDKQFVFSSEIKSILATGIKKELNEKALNTFFALTYIPAPNTMYENIYKLKPAHFAIIKNNRFEAELYYDLQSIINNNTLIPGYNECSKLLVNEVMDSVKSRMISDVPVGAFLSGGIDSSIIVGLMSQLSSKPINTFSIGFEQKSYDESDKATLVAKHNKTNHTQYCLHYDDVLNEIDDILLNFDEPFADASAIPTYFVSKLASEKVKVVLTGDAGDEIFGGYSKYLIAHYKNKYNKIPKNIRNHFIKPMINSIPTNDRIRKISRQLKRVVNAPDSIFDMRYDMMSLGYNYSKREHLLDNRLFNNGFYDNALSYYDSINKDELSRALFLDLNVVLEGCMLTKVDRTSMMNSLETRVPLLSPKVVELSYQIPNEYKIKGKSLKHIFKDSFYDILPPDIVNAPKKGFEVPVGEWMKKEINNDISSLLSKDFLEDQKIFNTSYVEMLFGKHIKGKQDYSNQLWSLYAFQKWYLKNF